MKNEGLSLDLIQANPSETAKSSEAYLEPEARERIADAQQKRWAATKRLKKP